MYLEEPDRGVPGGAGIEGEPEKAETGKEETEEEKQKRLKEYWLKGEISIDQYRLESRWLNYW